METADPRAWEQTWLPLWPLASDDLIAGLYRHSRREALGMRYVEANPDALSNLLVVDIDHGDAALRALGTRPLPHLIVENSRNGHAHAVWALREPVTRTEYARRKPLAFAASVVEGLRRAVDGDKGYSGLITKNPLHQAWESHQVTPLDEDSLYELDQLRAGLGDSMPPARWRETKTQRANPIGLGRNCLLFETARTWAYSEAKRLRVASGREHATPADAHALHTAITAQAAAINATFSEPLPASELRATATSIHKWTTTRFYGWTDTLTHQREQLARIQTARSRKGGLARVEARRAVRDERLAAL